MTRHSHLIVCCLLIALGLAVAVRAQEEADRPAGEATRSMVRMRQETPPVQIYPTPQELYGGGGWISLGPKSGWNFTVTLAGEARRLPLLESELGRRLQDRFGAAPGSGGGPEVVFALSAFDLPADREWMGAQLATLEGREGYVIRCAHTGGRDVVLVLGKSDAALWRALPTLAQLVSADGDSLRVPVSDIVDYPRMNERGLLVDLGGQGFMVGQARWELPQWKAFVDWMVDQKLNQLWLEIIGSGRLMGNLDPEKGEWIGFPVDLKSYPQLVCRDRPIRRWDEARGKVVEDTYTAPNVRHDFLRELIDYAQARGIKCVLMIGYDYFANQLPYVLGVPANNPGHRGANEVYDRLLREIVQRYDNARGVALITIENKNVPPSMVDEVVRRANEGRAIVKSINPSMDVGILNDYLEWRPREEFEHYAATMPRDVYQIYSPHTPPQNKSWKRLYGDVFRYELFSQYAWDHVAYIFPDRVRREIRESYLNGYRRIVTQAWYADVFMLNYAAMAEASWNPTGAPPEAFWTDTLERTFGAGRAAELMRTAFEHTRFDIRLDIVSRMILSNSIEKPFRFWDMYSLTVVEGLKDDWLAALEQDAKASLDAATAALALVRGDAAREMVEVTITSARRRYHLATSARAMLRSLAADRRGDKKAALAAMDECIAEGEKLVRAATALGIEFPMACHDDKVLDHYRQVRSSIAK